MRDLSLGAVTGGILGAVGGAFYGTWTIQGIIETGAKADTLASGMGGLVGAVATVLVVFLIELRKSNKERNNLAKLLYIDVCETIRSIKDISAVIDGRGLLQEALQPYNCGRFYVDFSEEISRIDNHLRVSCLKIDGSIDPIFKYYRDIKDIKNTLSWVIDAKGFMVPEGEIERSAWINNQLTYRIKKAESSLCDVLSVCHKYAR